MKLLSGLFVNFSILFLLFSCSQENDINEPTSEKVNEISFRPILNNLGDGSMLSFSNYPECNNNNPAFAKLVLSSDGNPVVGTLDSPLNVNIESQNINGETHYSTQVLGNLELEPGIYTLEYFQVFDNESNILWLAPLKNTTLDFPVYVNNPLPLEVNLEARTDNNVEVDVQCFDPRFINEYGYVFSHLEATETLKFCVFGNYCNENGHQVHAKYKVSVWEYSGTPATPKGINLYLNLENRIIAEELGDHSETTAEPLCLALPDESGTDEYYFEITILNNDYETSEKIIRSGVIKDSDINDIFNGDTNLEYYEFYEGDCDQGDSPEIFDQPNEVDPNLDTDRDGIPDVEDNCLYQYNPDQDQLEYYGDTCLEPCSIKTDDEVHRIIGLRGLDELTEYSTSAGFTGSLRFLDNNLEVGTLLGEFVDSNKLIINVQIDAGRYLEDHVIEIRDELESQSYCKIIHPAQIVPGTGTQESYSQFELQLPEDFSPPYYVRFKGNLYVDF